jgi:hypothetical protein
VVWREPDELLHTFPLEAGMLLRFEESEWHVFEYGDRGWIDAMFIYGHVDNIRPEEN